LCVDLSVSTIILKVKGEFGLMMRNRPLDFGLFSIEIHEFV